jgi:hypothetical protein
MAKKNITIDELAVMVQKGFAEQTEKFTGIGGRFDKVEKDLSIIKSQLAGVVYRPDFDKLESRVEYLENILALKKN